MKALIWMLRVSIGAVFIYAGAMKALDPAQFATQIDHFRVLPYFAVAPLALYLPWLELVCGAGVIFGKRRGAIVILLGLCAIFIFAIAAALARGLDITCGCFGASTRGELPWALGRDVLICAALLALLRLEKKSDEAAV